MSQEFFDQLEESFKNKQKLNLFAYTSLGGDDTSILYTRDEQKGLDQESEYVIIALHVKTKGFLAVHTHKLETSEGSRKVDCARLQFHNKFPSNFKRVDFKDLILFYLEN